jgi:hypothetical protein
VHAVVRPVISALRRIVESFGGTVPRVMGDGFLAIFGVPTAHEDDTERALRAARALLAHVEEVNRAGPRVVLPGLHVGVESGEVLVAPGEDGEPPDITGESINLASRLCSMASAGQVLAGPQAYSLARSVGVWSQPRRRRVRGLAELVPVAALEGVVDTRAGVRRVSQAFIGRAAEVAELAAALAEASTQLESVVLAVEGEPGVGKTTLVNEHLRRHDDALVLVGRAPAFGDVLPLSALMSALLSAEQLTGGESRTVLQRGVRSLLQRAGHARSATSEANLLRLLGAQASPPPGADDAVRSALVAAREILAGLATTSPVIVVLDELQWADDALRDALVQFEESPITGPVQIIAISRSDSPLPVARKLQVTGLDDDSMAQMVDQLLGTLDHAEVGRQLVRRAGGNPLFLEECARLVLDRPAGADPLVVPTTVRTSVAARLDALPPIEKDVLQVAAVAGDAVWDGLVASQLPSVDTDQHLRRLVERGLMTRHPSSSVPEQSQYGFHHALIREVAYDGLPRDERARRHRDIAQWLRDTEATLPSWEAPVGVLAHHYERSWQLSQTEAGALPNKEVGRLAAAYLAQWGRTMSAIHAGVAKSAYDRALAVLDSADVSAVSARVEVLTELAGVLSQQRDFAGAVEVADRALSAAGETGESLLRAEALRTKGAALSLAGDVAAAIPLLDEALADFQRADDEAGQARVLVDIAYSRRFSDLRGQLDAMNRAYNLFVDAGDRSNRTDLALDLAYLLTLSGGADYQRWAAEADRLVDQDTDPRRASELHRLRAFFALHSADYRGAVASADVALRRALEVGHVEVEADTHLVAAVASAALGELAESEAAVARAVRLADEMSWRRLRGMALLSGVRGALRSGRAQLAEERLREARQVLTELSSELDLLEAHVVEAEFWLERGVADAALVAADAAVQGLESEGSALFACAPRMVQVRAWLLTDPARAAEQARLLAVDARTLQAVSYAELADRVATQAELLAGTDPDPDGSGSTGRTAEARAVQAENQGLRAWRAGSAAVAAAALDRAAAEWAGLGATVWRARSLWWRAQAEDAAGDSREADTARRSALEVLDAVSAANALVEGFGFPE